MEPLDFYIYFLIGTAVAAYLISFAYKNVKFVLKYKWDKPYFILHYLYDKNKNTFINRVAQKREDAITKEISIKFADKKYSKKEKEDK